MKFTAAYFFTMANNFFKKRDDKEFQFKSRNHLKMNRDDHRDHDDHHSHGDRHNRDGHHNDVLERIRDVLRGSQNGGHHDGRRDDDHDGDHHNLDGRSRCP